MTCVGNDTSSEEVENGSHFLVCHLYWTLNFGLLRQHFDKTRANWGKVLIKVYFTFHNYARQ